MERIVDISTNGRHLSRDRGFLKVSEGGEEVGRTPLDQISALIVHAHGTTWSMSLLAELAERGVPTVICGPNHAPRSVLMPLEGNYEQSARMRAQWKAKLPFRKQAWKRIIVAKIEMQSSALALFGKPSGRLKRLIKTVSSGDNTNVEAQAARMYWPLMMGSDFKRDIRSAGINAMLNYGYTILRSATARAVVAAGLHPTVALHHSNRSNAFALADDLMEPFRPIVDCKVREIYSPKRSVIDTSVKEELAKIIAVNLPFEGGMSSVSTLLSKLAVSLARSYEIDKVSLALPQKMDPAYLANHKDD